MLNFWVRRVMTRLNSTLSVFIRNFVTSVGHTEILLSNYFQLFFMNSEIQTQQKGAAKRDASSLVWTRSLATRHFRQQQNPASNLTPRSSWFHYQRACMLLFFRTKISCLVQYLADQTWALKKREQRSSSTRLQTSDFTTDDAILTPTATKSFGEWDGFTTERLSNISPNSKI